MPKLTSQMVVAAVGALSVISLLMFAVAVAIPSWDHECKPASAGNFAANTGGELCRKAGLWEYCIRDDTNTTLSTFTRALERGEWECADVDTDDMNSQFGIKYKWRTAQAFASIAIALSIINLGVVALRFCADGSPKEDTYRKVFLVVAVLVILSGIIGTICWYDIGASGAGSVDIQSLRAEAPVPVEFETAFHRDRSEGSYGWSFGLFVFGWVLVLLTALLSELALAVLKPAPTLDTKMDGATPGDDEAKDDPTTSVI